MPVVAMTDLRGMKKYTRIVRQVGRSYSILGLIGIQFLHLVSRLNGWTWPGFGEFGMFVPEQKEKKKKIKTKD